MYDVDEEKLRHTLKQLNWAIHHHEQWHRDFMRAIIGRLPGDPHDLAADAHHHCQFGQWYDRDASPELRARPAFVGMEKAHQRMHQLAAGLLETSSAGSPITLEAYDEFAASVDRLSVHTHALRKELEGAIENRDPLTGTENRMGMFADLRRQQDMVKRNVQECCVAFMDVDHFKEINDAHGHHVGDEVLVTAAHYVMKHLRPYDKVYRYGGEEFLIMMPGTDLRTGTKVLERMREALAIVPLARHEPREIYATVSFGVALLDPDAGVEETIERADQAMYDAKNSGRNRTSVWERPTASA